MGTSVFLEDCLAPSPNLSGYCIKSLLFHFTFVELLLSFSYCLCNLPRFRARCMGSTSGRISLSCAKTYVRTSNGFWSSMVRMPHSIMGSIHYRGSHSENVFIALMYDRYPKNLTL